MATEPERGTIQLRLGAVAIGTFLVAFSTLTALIVVVSLRDADLLSVVALALAVVAFSVQLIIFVVQASESASSARRTLELHTQLSALLSELRERTGRTQRSVDSINSQLLAAVIDKTRSASDSPSSQEFGDRVAETYVEVSRAEESTRATTETAALPRYPGPLPAEKARDLHEYMSLWPGKSEVDDVRAELAGMNKYALESLCRSAKDLWAFTNEDSMLGPGLWRNPLLGDLGLLEKVNESTFYTLNVHGRKLGRVFTATGTPPEWVEPLLPIREDGLRREDLRRRSVASDKRDTSDE